MKDVSSKTRSVLIACALLVSILLLWIYKIPFLGLPFFTDEAWSYIPAVWAMDQNYLSLFPGSIPPDLYRGHPLLFYCMNAAVAKIFGFSPCVLHCFALLMASSFLIVFFFILQQFTNQLFALLGTLLLLTQEVFIVQSSFMLPEIFISLLTFLVVYCLAKEKRFLYFLFATLLVLTKESGLVIIAAAGFSAAAIFIKQRWHDGRKMYLPFINYVLLIFSPLLSGIAFYVLQKKICGWYFFPFHIQLIDFSLHSMVQHALLIREFVFTGYGRMNLIVLLGFIIIMSFIFRRRLQTPGAVNTVKITAGLLSVFVVYFFFSIVNFIALRYLILPIVIFIFLLIIWSYRLHQSGFKFFSWLICVAIGFSLYHDFTSNPSWIDDVSLNYTDEVMVHQQAVNFMDTGADHSKKIFTFFLMRYNLTDPALFYLHGLPFRNVTSDDLQKDADYYIFSNLLLTEPYYDYAKSNDSLQIIKRFGQGKAWCEIFARK